MQVYSLTELTRNASADRRVVIQGFDLPMRGLMIVGIAAIPALIVTIIGWVLVGEYAVLLFVGVEMAAYWLIETRSRRGLQLKRYQTILDRYRSIDGRFTCCGVEIDPLHGTWATIRSSSVHRPVTDSFDVESLYREPLPTQPSARPAVPATRQGVPEAW